MSEKPEVKVYGVQMACTNCGHQCTLQFVCGKEVPRRNTCPKCGCWTMLKLLKITPPIKASGKETPFHGCGQGEVTMVHWDEGMHTYISTVWTVRTPVKIGHHRTDLRKIKPASEAK